MLIAGVVMVAVVVFGSITLRRSRTRGGASTGRMGATVMAFTMAGAALLLVGNSANAAIVPTVPLATAANYAVLGGSTVTNTGATTLNGSLGLWPGTVITGFPPGKVLPPGTTDKTNAAAKQAQSALTAAYVNAAGRPINATTTADLANRTLQGGVYAGPSKGALSLTGPLTLDGAGNPNSVFIFQTNSTLITGSGSTVRLINGAQACNVFWQVGSSATLGAGSVFTGNILALTAITVTAGVTVHGRALARNGAVTLNTDTFTKPTCSQAPPPTTTTTTRATTVPGTPTGVSATAGNASAMVSWTAPSNGGSPITSYTVTPFVNGVAQTPVTVSGSATSTTVSGLTNGTTYTFKVAATNAVGTGAASGPSNAVTPAAASIPLPATGSPIGPPLVVAAVALTLGVVAIRYGRAKKLAQR